jgi:MoaA/NifB/PqqE/SkfB family radical SAM enzyme
MEIIMIEDAKNKNAQCKLPEYFYSKDDIKKLFLHRNIYIWGASRDGRGVFHALKRNGYEITAFIDRCPDISSDINGGGGGRYLGVPIVRPEIILNGSKNIARSSIIILALFKEKSKVIELLKLNGFEEGVSFIHRLDLCPVVPSIEISGSCNLKCLACPRSDESHPFENGGFISVDNYKKVINKLLSEIPMMHIVYLFVWGDPLLHPNLPEILKINSDLGLASDISTNLNIKTDKLEEIIKANPTYLRLSCSGYGSMNYEFTHMGAKWELFYKNCHEVSKLIKKFKVDTGVEIYFHVNKLNIAEYKDVEDMAKQLGFMIYPTISLLFPKYAMDLSDGIGLPTSAQNAKDIMLISIENMIGDAKKEHEKTCLSSKGFPNINWDLSVLTCCNFNQDRLAPNFLNIDIKSLIKLKNNSDLCKKCITYSIHRYFIPQRYRSYIENLLSGKCSI